MTSGGDLPFLRRWWWRRRLRGAGYVSLSLGLHGAVVLALSWAAVQVELRPKLDVVWLNLDNKLGGPSEPPPVEEPKPEPPPKVKKAAVGAKTAEKPKPVKKRRPKKRPYETDQVELSGLAPGDAALILLLRCDRIRDSPYAQSVRELLEVFYDYKTLLWSSDIDPVRDFEALLIATPNPYRVTRTFLAARHALAEGVVKGAVEQAVQVGEQPMGWLREGAGWVGQIPSPPRLRHDPRVVVLQDDLLLLVDPQLRRELAERTAASASRRRARRSAKGAGGAAMLDLLRRIDDEGGEGQGGPGLLLQAINVPRLVRLPAGVPPPRNVQVTVPVTDPAEVHGVLSFAKATEAAAFTVQLERTLTRAKRSLLLMALGYSRLIERIAIKPVERRVEVRLNLPAGELIQLLAMFRDLIPQVYVPGMPARVRRPAPATPAAPAVPAAGPSAAKVLKEKAKRELLPQPGQAPAPAKALP